MQTNITDEVKNLLPNHRNIVSSCKAWSNFYDKFGINDPAMLQSVQFEEILSLLDPEQAELLDDDESISETSFVSLTAPEIVPPEDDVMEDLRCMNDNEKALVKKDVMIDQMKALESPGVLNEIRDCGTYFLEKVTRWMKSSMDFSKNMKSKRNFRFKIDTRSQVTFEQRTCREDFDDDDDDDSLASIDTAKYILSNRKKKTTKMQYVTKTTIKQFCVMQSKTTSTKSRRNVVSSDSSNDAIPLPSFHEKRQSSRHHRDRTTNALPRDREQQLSRRKSPTKKLTKKRPVKISTILESDHESDIDFVEAPVKRSKRKPGRTRLSIKNTEASDSNSDLENIPSTRSPIRTKSSRKPPKKRSTPIKRTRIKPPVVEVDPTSPYPVPSIEPSSCHEDDEPPIVVEPVVTLDETVVVSAEPVPPPVHVSNSDDLIQSQPPTVAVVEELDENSENDSGKSLLNFSTSTDGDSDDVTHSTKPIIIYTTSPEFTNRTYTKMDNGCIIIPHQHLLDILGPGYLGYLGNGQPNCVVSVHPTSTLVFHPRYPPGVVPKSEYDCMGLKNSPFEGHLAEWRQLETNI